MLLSHSVQALDMQTLLCLFPACWLLLLYTANLTPAAKPQAQSTDVSLLTASCFSTLLTCFVACSLEEGTTLQTAVASKLLRPPGAHTAPYELTYHRGRDGQPSLRPVWMELPAEQTQGEPSAARSRPQLWTIKSGTKGAIVPASHSKCAQSASTLTSRSLTGFLCTNNAPALTHFTGFTALDMLCDQACASSVPL